MWLNYFVHKGKTYRSGTIIKAEYFRGTRLTKGEMVFVAVNSESGNYFVKYIDDYYRVCGLSPKMFFASIVEVTDRVDPKVHCPVRKRRAELDIPGMLGGWVWYVVLMFVASIFKGNVVLWFYITVYFLFWRRRKINEEGYYIER